MAISHNTSGRVPISIVNNQIKKLPTSNRSYSTSDLNKKVNQLNLHKIAKDNSRARSIASSFYRPSTKSKETSKEMSSQNGTQANTPIRSPSISINDKILYEGRLDCEEEKNNTSQNKTTDERDRPIRSVSLSLINRGSSLSSSSDKNSNFPNGVQSSRNDGYSAIDCHYNTNLTRHNTMNSETMHEITFGSLPRKHKSSSEHYDVRMSNFRLRGPSSIHQSLQSLPENVNEEMLPKAMGDSLLSNKKSRGRTSRQNSSNQDDNTEEKTTRQSSPILNKQAASTTKSTDANSDRKDKNDLDNTFGSPGTLARSSSDRVLTMD